MLALGLLFHVTFLLLCLLLLSQNLSHHPASLGVFANVLSEDLNRPIWLRSQTLLWSTEAKARSVSNRAQAIPLICAAWMPLSSEADFSAPYHESPSLAE